MAGKGQGLASWLGRRALGTGMTVGTVAGGAWAVDEFILDNFVQDLISGEVTPEEAAAIIGDLAQTGANEIAQIGPETQFQGFYAIVEQLGVLWNNFMGGDAGLGLINWARDAQQGKPPLIYNNGELIPTVDARGETNLPPLNNTDIDLATADLAEIFESTAFETALRDEIMRRYPAGSNVQSLNNEEVFEATVVSALARIDASDATIDQVHTLFEQGDLSGQFNANGVLMPVGNAVQHEFARQADAFFERGAELFRTSDGDLAAVARGLESGPGGPSEKIDRKRKMVKPENQKQFQGGTPVTQEMFEKHREADAVTSNETAIEGLNDKLRQTRGGVMGGAFKVAGGSIQAIATLTPQRDQQAIKGLATVAQVGAGAVGVLTSAFDTFRTWNRLENKSVAASLKGSTIASNSGQDGGVYVRAAGTPRDPTA